MNNNLVVSLVKYSLCAIISTLTTHVSSLGWPLSSFFNSDNKMLYFMYYILILSENEVKAGIVILSVLKMVKITELLVSFLLSTVSNASR